MDSQDDLGSYDEEYTHCQDLTLSTKDYIRSFEIANGQYKDVYEKLGAEGQRSGTLSDIQQTYQLPFKSMSLAVDGIREFFGSMSVCEGSNKVNITEKVHTILLSGNYYGEFQIFVRGQIGFNADYGCVIKLSVRSCNAEVSQSLLECIN